MRYTPSNNINSSVKILHCIDHHAFKDSYPAAEEEEEEEDEDASSCSMLLMLMREDCLLSCSGGLGLSIDCSFSILLEGTGSVRMVCGWCGWCVMSRCWVESGLCCGVLWVVCCGGLLVLCCGCFVVGVVLQLLCCG